MENEGKIILVAGATGKQGSAVIRHLQEKGWKIRALTRNSNSKAAQGMTSKGIDVIQGNMNDLQSLEKAMDNAYGVFSVQDFWIVGVKEEIQQGKNMADTAKKAGVQHFIYSSAAGADRESGVDHFESKFVIEEYIRNISLQATILRPVGFMENYNIPRVKNGILKGKLAHPVMADKKLQLIPTDDIGALVAAAFEEPEKFFGLAIDIASDELTNPEIAETFSKVMGRPIRFNKLPMLIVRLFMGKELHRMFRWINKVGYDVDIPTLQSNNPEVKLTSLEEWLLRDGWGKMNAK
jgi:uncharacterized protein YbjT (DUF2867 family)